MHSRPCLFVVLSLAAIAAGVARAEEAGLRIRFGLNDEQPTDWSGTVEVSPGAAAAHSRRVPPPHRDQRRRRQ